MAKPKDTGPWCIFLLVPTPKTSDTKRNITEFKMLLYELPNSLSSLQAWQFLKRPAGAERREEGLEAQLGGSRSRDWTSGSFPYCPPRASFLVCWARGAS